MRIILLAVACFFITSHSSATAEVLASYSLTKPGSKTIRSLSEHFGLEHWRGDSVEIIVPRSQVPLLLSLAPAAKLLESDTAAAAKARLLLFSIRAAATGGGYHSFDEVQKWMKGIESARPDLAKVILYGTSGDGRPLLALRLNKDAMPKPVLMFTAATHGDELITTELLIGLVDQLIAGHGTDARLTALIEKHDLYFVPVLNPDGFTAASRFDGWSDPNRSYPWPGHANAAPTPSIAGIIHLYDLIHPVGSIDFHAYGKMIMYPWAYTRSPVDPAAGATFAKLTLSMAAANNYVHGPISDVIYVAPGSSADYYFWKSNCLSLGIEVGSEKIPDPSEIPAYVHSQAESLWRFIEAF